MSVFLFTPILLLFICQPLTRSLPLHPKPRIVSGVQSKSSQFPFIAALRSIEHDRNGLAYMSEVWCGGSLLRKEYPAAILTSSHCVHNTTKQLIVELNATDVQQTPTIGVTAWPVISYIIHEQFDLFLLNNDIALVFIDADLTERTDLFLSTVTIPNLVGTECCSSNEILETIGYGKTAIDAAYSATLEYTDLQYIDRDTCNTQLCLWETHSSDCPWYYANNNNICGLGDASTPCHGDSGGPLVKKDTNEQVGIISWGILCISTLPTIFTNTGVYYEWIQHQLKESAPTTAPITTSAAPTKLPTATPTKVPTAAPSRIPTTNPTDLVTKHPTVAPTKYTALFTTNAPTIRSTTTSTAGTTRRTKAPIVSTTNAAIESTVYVERTTKSPETSTQSTDHVTTAAASSTRYSWKIPTVPQTDAPSEATEEAQKETTGISSTTPLVSTTALSIDNTVDISSTVMWPTLDLGILNPIDMAVLNGRTIDEYVIIIILAGISGVAIFIIGVLCLQQYRCGAKEKNENQAYDRVKIVSNPLVYTDEEEDDPAVPQAIECVAIDEERQPVQIRATEIETMEDDHVIDDLMAETTASQTPNNSLLTAFTLQSAN